VPDVEEESYTQKDRKLICKCKDTKFQMQGIRELQNFSKVGIDRTTSNDQTMKYIL